MRNRDGIAVFLCLVFLALLAPRAYADLDCIACHGPNGPHEEGFEGCNVCHGYPPITSELGVDGLVKYPSPTGGTSPGAHAKHATAAGYSYPCRTCHSNGMTAEGGIIQDPRQLELGFSIFGVAGGLYDGRTLLAPYSYTAGMGTTITTGGSMTCSNIYCHSNGTSVSTGAAPPCTSPSWTSGVPLGCDSCHGYPPAYEQDNPKANGHFKHGHNTHPCSDCHYATTTDGVHITDVTKHINGQYDVVADPTVRNAFTYTWDAGGGTCSNAMCHGLNHSDSGIAVWGDESCQLSVTVAPGADCFERIFSVVGNSYNTCRLPGISYLWDFGDGQTSTEVSPSHTYASAGSYVVQVEIRDADNHPGSAGTGVFIQNVNLAPVPYFSLVSVSGNTVTLRDLSRDPDYNLCGHSGPGQIRIYWNLTGSLTTLTPINLTDLPSNQDIAYTYAASGINVVRHQVMDNQNVWASSTGRATVRVPADASSINISGRITHTDGTPFPGATVFIQGLASNRYPITDAQGYFQILGFAPGCYTIGPNAITGYTFTPSSATVCTSTTSANFVASP